MSSGESKVDLTCSDAFDALAIKTGTAMTVGRTSKVGTKKIIPISMEIDGAESIPDGCGDLYFLSLSVVLASGRKHELWSEEEVGVCFDYNYNYIFSGDWNWNNYYEYTREIKACPQKDFMYLEDGNLVIDMNQ